MSVTKCPICDGAGKVMWFEDGAHYVGASPKEEGDTCHACDGKGVFVDPSAGVAKSVVDLMLLVENRDHAIGENRKRILKIEQKLNALEDGAFEKALSNLDATGPSKCKAEAGT